METDDSYIRRGYQDHCDFCVELNGGTSDFFSSEANFPPYARLIHTLEGLCLFSSLGQILQGHLLLAPCYHTTSMLRLLPEDEGALRKATELIQNVFSKKFDETPLFFEHGDPTQGHVASGQCITHAHLHILPKFVDLVAPLSAFAVKIGKGRLEEVIPMADQPYFLVSDSDGFFHLFEVGDAPRQFLRRLYSQEIGRPERALWYENIDYTETVRSAEIFRKLFKA